MAEIRAATTVVWVVTMVAGCGGADHGPRSIITEIFSDPTYDGDISHDPISETFTVTAGNTQSVFAGVDPATGLEYRAFLDFPLGGARGVPADADILSATMDLFVDNILPQPLVGTLPFRIDLVSFQPPTLLAADYDLGLQPALMSTFVSPPISSVDLQGHVPVEVTALMQTAQDLALPDLQVRILLDVSADVGLVEIDDTTEPGQEIFAPLLQVEYL